ncbi:DUF6531 domain-containing protein [Streptomyces qinglanensis]|uniref:DUF6531 domain-containing protein n=1 Tax=Streptomyces qinglanensis TaxID=943816 RepID=UPI003D751636
MIVPLIAQDPFGAKAAWGGAGSLNVSQRDGVAVPGEPITLSASVWNLGPENHEVEWRDVKVTWEVDPCTRGEDITYDFDQVVSAPSWGDDSSRDGPKPPVVSAQIPIPDEPCSSTQNRILIWAHAEVLEDPDSPVGSAAAAHVIFQVVPSLANGPARGGLCGDASGSPRADVLRADPINTATGTFTECLTDARVPAPGVAFEAKRTYSSDITTSGALGRGWLLPWEVSLHQQEDGDVVLHGEGGARHLYAEQEDGGYSTPDWARSRLSALDGGHRLTTGDHRTYSFDATGRLTALKSQAGQGLEFAYAGGRVSSIRDAAGRTVALSYSGDRLMKLTLDDGRSVTYAYTDGLLSTVTGTDGETEHYAYDADHQLSEITDARGNVRATNVYDDKHRVTSQTDAAGGKTSFAYTKTGVFDQIDVTAPDGGVWTDIYHDNVLFEQLDPFGNQVQYGYDRHFNRTSAMDALLRYTSWDYDKRGRQTGRRTADGDESWSYDADGNISSYEDGEYNEWTYAYNANHLLTSVEDPSGHTTRFTYSASGLPKTVTSPGGGTTTYGYDTVGNQLSVTSPEGRKTTRTFDQAGRAVSVTSPRGNEQGADAADFTRRYAYDAADRLTKVTGPDGDVTSYGYDESGNLTTVTDAAERVSSYRYDAANRQVAWKDPSGKTATYAYDALGHLSSFTDRTGAKTTHTYDKGGRRVTTVTARGHIDGADAGKHTWRYGYDKVSNLITVTDPLDHTTAIAYDAENRPVSTTNPLGQTRQVSYDDNGNVTRIQNAFYDVRSLKYDANQRLVSAESKNGEATKFEYDADGNLTAETSPLSERTTHAYDQDGLLTATVDPRGREQGADPADFTWKFGYDADANPVSITDPLGNQRTAEFDAYGNRTAATDATGHTTRYAFDALHRVDRVTAPDGGTTTLGYDTAGNLATTTDAEEHTTSYGHDAEGRQTSTTDPLKRTVRSAYDAEGNLTRATNARGQTITATLDPLGRTTKVDYSDDTPDTLLTYDELGRPTKVTDATGTRALTYDDGQLASITAPGAPKGFKYRYQAGRVRYRYDTEGEDYRRSYDDNGRVTSQRFNYQTVTYGYDAAGNLTSTTLPTDTERGETRAYDAAGRLASLTTPAGKRTFTRDAEGRITADTPAEGPATRYAYDDAGRMTRTCTDTSDTSCLAATGAGTTYAYDKSGNLLTEARDGKTTSHTYDTAGQLTKTTAGSATTSYAYDADGNQTKDGSDTYTYDPAGRVTSADLGADAYSFTYDADGNRTQTRKNGKPARTTHWDINSPLPQIATEYDGAGSLLAEYQDAPTGLPQSAHRAGKDTYLTHDRQNSVTGVWDTAGTETHRYTYGPWGITDSKKGSGSGQPSAFGYTGQYKDPVLPDRLLLRARSYDPTQHRFTTTDPIRAGPDSANQSPYAYADNDPANQSDPSGLCPPCVRIIGGGTIGGLIGGTSYTLNHWDDFNWRDFAKASGKGALIGAGAGFLAPAGGSFSAAMGLQGGRAYLTSTLVNAGVGAGYTWAVNTVQCQPTTPTDLLIGATGGGAANLTGPAWSSLKASLRKTPTARASGLQLDMPQLPSARGPAGKTPAVVETHSAPPNWSHASQMQRAEGLIEGFALKNYTRRTGTRTYVGGYNTRTGEIAVASSGGRFPGMAYCAEGNVCLALGGDITKVRFTNAYTVRKTGEGIFVKPKPVCESCQVDYSSPFQFRKGVRHKSPGPWDEGNF